MVAMTIIVIVLGGQGQPCDTAGHEGDTDHGVDAL